jgi:hypothetical protein
VQRKGCSIDGCVNRARKAGLCRAHGAQLNRCSVDGCEKQIVKRGLCRAHGAQVKMCTIDGCLKNGLCMAHQEKN